MGPSDPFYGADQAAIHHEAFGDLAAQAAARLLSALDAAGLHRGTVVDLGCGSGILARIVSDAGYDVRGVDISEDMLRLARANAPGATFARGSLLDAELPHAVAVTAIGEALNYATDPRAGLDEVERLAARVHAALDPAASSCSTSRPRDDTASTSCRSTTSARDGACSCASRRKPTPASIGG